MSFITNYFINLSAVLLLSLMVIQSAYAAPKAELWSYWQQDNPSNTKVISHQAWQELLNRYLSVQGENTLFAYNNVTASDKKKLTTYIHSLANLDPRVYAKDEQYAYWVNLYNALTVQRILQDYPIKSITKLGGLFSFGPWKEELVTINGKALSLNDIEHRILRPIWQDPRTHYAVNCASLGCPNLQPTAFNKNNKNALLEKAATEFINSDKGVLLQGNDVQLSEIYDWFKVDFGSDAQLWQHLRKYRPSLTKPSGKVSFEYNWDLNQPQ